jgi:hypothetical protein
VSIQLSREFATLKSEIWGLVEEEVRKHVEADQYSLSMGG